MIDPVYFPHLEIQIAEHCNLNCASCTHFSPLAEPSFIDEDSFYSQLKQANRIFEGKCKSLKIMGGEPLLHPSVAKLLLLARDAMPKVKIMVQTNGILLTQMPDEFWTVCHDKDILIRVTRYPVNLEIEIIKALARKFDVNLKFHPEGTVVKSFNLYPINIAGTGDTDKNFADCRMKHRYVLIKDNKLFPCPIAGNAEHFNAAFGTALDCSEKNYVWLDQINSFADFSAFAEKSIAFCKHCQPSEYRRDIGWSHSRKNIREWTGNDD